MTDPAPTSTASLPVLTAWRAVAAVFVFWFHFGKSWALWPACAGVSGLLVMSGFLTAMHHPQAPLGRGHARYLLHRAARLYPVHWLALLCIIAVKLLWPGGQGTALYWPALLPNALLVQSFIPVREFYLSFVALSWFFSDIMFCYLCYPLLRRLLWRLSLRGRVLLMATIMLLYALVLWRCRCDGALLSYLHVLPVARLIDFATGIVAFDCWQALQRRGVSLRGWRAAGAEAAVVVLLVLLWVAGARWPAATSAFSDALWWDLPMAGLCVVAALANGHEGPLGQLLRWRPLVWLGSISCEMFLFQGAVAIAFVHTVCPLLGHFGIEAYSQACYTALPAIVLVAWLVHRCFTRPVSRWLGAQQFLRHYGNNTHKNAL